MDSETVTYMILAGAGALTLGAFGFLIVIPAWSAYGRLWERVAASFMSLFMLATLLGVGVGLGALFLLLYAHNV
jgi:hypothetical protein